MNDRRFKITILDHASGVPKAQVCYEGDLYGAANALQFGNPYSLSNGTAFGTVIRIELFTEASADDTTNDTDPGQM